MKILVPRIRNPRRVPGRTRLTCRQVGRVLQAYLDDELDAEAARKVAAHLDDCRRCGLEGDTYRALKASLGRGSGRLADEPVTRLRQFGEQLAAGEIDPDEMSAP